MLVPVPLDVPPDVLPLDERFLFLLPDLRFRFMVPCPEVLPLDWVPTLPAPDDEPVEPDSTVDPLLRPALPDVPLCPDVLPDDVPDWVLPEPVVPCDEELPLPDVLDCACTPAVAIAISNAAVITVAFIR